MTARRDHCLGSWRQAARLSVVGRPASGQASRLPYRPHRMLAADPCKCPWRRASVCVLVGLQLAALTQAQDAVAPGEIRTYTTMQSLGIEWDVTGDANHNATCAVTYRPEGAAEWKQAMNLFRIDYFGQYGDRKAERGYNMVAGSILFLKPGTGYEVKLALTDPDGGGQEQTLRVKTRAIPVLTRGGRTLHVVPGQGGGDGSAQNPFRGLATAQAAAQPGDQVLLHKGDYGAFTFNRPGAAGGYIAYKGAGDGDATFKEAVISAGHLWLDGLAFEAGADPGGGLRAEGAPEDVVVTACHFKGFHYSITLSGASQDWYIARNVIEGEKQDLDKSDISGEGIELNHSNGHVVAYNRISRVADGVSYCGHDCDIHDNDIHAVTDDGIEPDYGYANNRMWGNRITRSVNEGFSFQPQYCGPWYIVRNEVVGRKNLLKSNWADRFVLVNNTLVCHGRYAQGRADLLLKSFCRNNLWILIRDEKITDRTYAIWYADQGGRKGPYSMEFQPLPDWRSDVDYDGFDWDRTPTPFWWQIPPGRMKMYNDLASFAQEVGIEKHAIRVRKEEIFAEPDILAYMEEAFPQRRLFLKPGCNAIDAGQVVPNIADDFDGAAPDLGAYEGSRVVWPRP